MTQEVEITVRGEFDIELDKKRVKNLVQTVLNQSPFRRDLILNVVGVKEEAELYKTDERISANKLLMMVYKDICDTGEVSVDTTVAVTNHICN